MSKSNVLIVEDDGSLREALTDTVELAGYKTLAAENGKLALEMLDNTKPSIVVSDVRMDGMDGHQLLRAIQKQAPGVPVILITAHGNINDAVTAMRSGAADYIIKPFEPQILIEKIEKYISPVAEHDIAMPIAQDPKSKQLLSLAERVAQSDATVLISGESGTGKEVLARYIHDHSARKHKPFIAINCAAIPEQMLEATLFGYEKGAFTGAYKAMPGKFEQAQEGTLLLDEISEMDLSLQAKLLRVLQEKEVERIGGNKIVRLNVRVLATSNRNMKEEVDSGKFREDLYFRLNVFPLHWIPLRERSQDILPMAEYLIDKHWANSKPRRPLLSEEAKSSLISYTWPGNAREMDNVIQRALILQTGDMIEVDDLQLPSACSNQPSKSSLSQGLQQQEYDMILDSIQNNNGNRKKVAQDLNISERTLRYKLAKMREAGIEV